MSKIKILLAIPLVIFCLLLPACSKTQEKTSVSEKVQINKSDPWTKDDIIMPKTLTAELKSDKEKPMLIQVGFKMLYNQSHIPGSVFTGPASINKGIDVLKDTLKNVSRDKNIVLYCGCCEWKECPNIRPAFKIVKEMGFKNAKILYLKNTFVIDWVKKGYPAAK